MEGESGEDVGSLLAGEFMGDFGGFLSRDLRVSDFALGYESSLPGFARDSASAGSLTTSASGLISFCGGPPPVPARGGARWRASLSDLSLADRLQLVRLAAHGARVLGAGAIDLWSRIPDGPDA